MLSVSGLKKIYEVRKNPLSLRKDRIRALWDISFDLERGKTLGIVGESGSGKSTLAKCLLLLERPNSGRILFLGKDLLTLKRGELKNLRRYMQIIFQDPYSSLNPRMKIIETLSEPLLFHGLCEKRDIRERVIEILKKIGMDEDVLERYPHELSGGQRQRIAIGRAIATEPLLLVADEPLSSLDLSIQAQILNLFLDIKEKMNLTLIFISHDLFTVEALSDYILVLYKGKIVEMGKKEKVFEDPLHPYTETLLYRKIPKSNETKEESEEGCVFFLGCRKGDDFCKKNSPPLKGEKDHRIACFKVD